MTEQSTQPPTSPQPGAPAPSDSSPSFKDDRQSTEQKPLTPDQILARAKRTASYHYNSAKAIFGVTDLAEKWRNQLLEHVTKPHTETPEHVQTQ